MAELVVAHVIGAPQQRVWDVLTDWSIHDEWMLLTRAEGDDHAGGTIRAFTGVGPIGFLDTMTILTWEPPTRVVARHTGRLVRGSASFELQPLAADRTRVVWSEWLQVPFGPLGRLAWPAVRLVAGTALQVSLRRLGRYVERSP